MPRFNSFPRPHHMIQQRRPLPRVSTLRSMPDIRAAQGALAYLFPAALCARRHCVRKPRLSAPQGLPERCSQLCAPGQAAHGLQGCCPAVSEHRRRALRSEISADDDSPNVGCFPSKDAIRESHVNSRGRGAQCPVRAMAGGPCQNLSSFSRNRVVHHCEDVLVHCCAFNLHHSSTGPTAENIPEDPSMTCTKCQGGCSCGER